MFRRGDPVICRVRKTSSHPGPRAQNVDPAPRGETYSYQVDKFWVVADILGDGRLVLRTRRGKKHLLSGNDPRLRQPRWWERIRHRDRFPQLEIHQKG